VTCQEVFGEALGALKPGGGLVRAKDSQVLFPEAVGNPGHQGRLRPDNGQVDAVVHREAQEPVNVLGAQIQVTDARLPRCAGIAGGHVDGLHIL